MIDISLITKHIQGWLEEGEDLAGVAITRSEFVNEDPGKAANGWVGVYRRGVNYDPRNLGTAINNYEGNLTVDIVVQKTHYGSGEEAEDSLEGLIENVLNRLIQIPKTYIYHFSELSVNYAYLETDRETMYFQGAIITTVADVVN